MPVMMAKRTIGVNMNYKATELIVSHAAECSIEVRRGADIDFASFWAANGPEPANWNALQIAASSALG